MVYLKVNIDVAQRRWIGLVYFWNECYFYSGWLWFVCVLLFVFRVGICVMCLFGYWFHDETRGNSWKPIRVYGTMYLVQHHSLHSK